MSAIFNIATPHLACDIPDGTCLLAYRGSIAHNMYVPNTDPNSIDDVDLMGIVLAPVENYLGLREWGSRGTREYKQGKYDCVFYEIRKAFHLLLQGNPNILSLLWVRNEDILVRSTIGTELRKHRDLFVGKHVYASFAGYASAQLQKMETREPEELRRYIAITNELKYRGAHPNHKGERFDRSQPESGIEVDVGLTSTEKLLQRLKSYQKKGENLGYLGDKRKQLVLNHGYDSKNAAHCIRLLRMCKEFMGTGNLIVYRTEDAEELLDIKRGKWELAVIKEYAEQLFAEIKVARDHSQLPEQPDHEGVERLLVATLREHFRSSA